MTSDAEARARFERLYRDHAPAVRRYALRRTDRATADDVVNRTFEICWQKLERVPAEPLPWLLLVARRVLAGQRRAAKRAAPSEQLAGATRDPAELIAERDIVLRAFARLSERDREALRLVAWDCLDRNAAALVAGCSRATFAVRLHRAKRRLSEQLGALDATTLSGTRASEAR